MSKEFLDKVCKLQRSTYRLKQAFKKWNLRFDKAMRFYDFINNEDKSCLY